MAICKKKATNNTKQAVEKLNPNKQQPIITLKSVKKFLSIIVSDEMISSKNNSNSSRKYIRNKYNNIIYNNNKNFNNNIKIKKIFDSNFDSKTNTNTKTIINTKPKPFDDDYDNDDYYKIIEECKNINDMDLNTNDLLLPIDMDQDINFNIVFTKQAAVIDLLTLLEMLPKTKILCYF